jgi:hypothetical protein
MFRLISPFLTRLDFGVIRGRRCRTVLTSYMILIIVSIPVSGAVIEDVSSGVACEGSRISFVVLLVSRPDVTLEPHNISNHCQGCRGYIWYSLR